MNHDMECRDVRPEILPLLHGELESGRKVQVQNHLEKCSVCSEERNLLIRTMKMLAFEPPEPEEIERSWDKLQFRIASSRRDAIKRHRLEIGLAVGIIALLGGVSLVWLIRLNDQILLALEELFKTLGISLPWITQGPLSFFAAPFLFILLCSLMTTILSPFLLRHLRRAGSSGRGAISLENLQPDISPSLSGMNKNLGGE